MYKTSQREQYNQLILFDQIKNIITIIMFSFAFLLALSTSLTLSLAQKPGSYAPAVPEAHQPFTYQYGVADDYSKSNFQKSESQDPNVRILGIRAML